MDRFTVYIVRVGRLELHFKFVPRGLGGLHIYGRSRFDSFRTPTGGTMPAASAWSVLIGRLYASAFLFTARPPP